MLVVLAALLVPAAPASAHTLTLSKATRLAKQLDAKYKREARSPVDFSEIFRPRRRSAHRIDFSYYVLHENGRECFATIKVRFRSGSQAARANFQNVDCTGPDQP